MSAIFAREFKSLFKGLTGYIFTVFVLVFAGIYVMANNLSGGYPNFEYALGSMTMVYLIGIPVLTMRVFAEERHQKTDQLLYSLPIPMTKVVLGKYFALCATLLIPILVMALYPLMLSLYGTVSMRLAYSTLFAFFLLGAALISMGMFISSLTENQVVAAVLCLLFMLLNYYLSTLSSYVSDSAVSSFLAFTALLLLVGIVCRLQTKSWLIAGIVFVVLELALGGVMVFKPDVLAGLFPDLMYNLSLFERFYVFMDGILDLTAIVYFLSVIVVFVYLTIQSMETRRWN